MANNFYGKNVLVKIQDSIYEASKHLDTDSDANTKSSRLSSTQQLAARDLLKNNLRIDETKATDIVKALMATTSGITLMLSPVQYAAIQLAIQAQSTKYIQVLSFEAQVKSDVIDVSGLAKGLVSR